MITLGPGCAARACTMGRLSSTGHSVRSKMLRVSGGGVAHETRAFVCRCCCAWKCTMQGHPLSSGWCVSCDMLGGKAGGPNTAVDNPSASAVAFLGPIMAPTTVQTAEPATKTSPATHSSTRHNFLTQREPISAGGYNLRLSRRLPAAERRYMQGRVRRAAGLQEPPSGAPQPCMALMACCPAGSVQP